MCEVWFHMVYFWVLSFMYKNNVNMRTWQPTQNQGLMNFLKAEVKFYPQFLIFEKPINQAETLFTYSLLYKTECCI